MRLKLRRNARTAVGARLRQTRAPLRSVSLPVHGILGARQWKYAHHCVSRLTIMAPGNLFVSSWGGDILRALVELGSNLGGS